MEEATPGFDRRSADRLLGAISRRSLPWIAIMGLSALLVAGAELALPALIGHAVDAVVAGEDTTRWVVISVVLLVLLVIADAVEDVAAGYGTAGATAWLRSGMVAHVVALGPRGGGFAAGDVANRLVGNSAHAGRVGQDVVRALVSLVPALGALVALALIDPWLCAAFLVGLPVLALVVRAFARVASDIASRYLSTQAVIADRLVDALAGARTIAAAHSADREARRVLAPLPELHRHGMAMWRAHMRITAQEAVITPLVQVGVLAVAGALLAADRISPGEMIAASGYVFLATNLGGVTGLVGQLARSRAAAARAAEVLDTPTLLYGDAQLPPGRGTVELRGVRVEAEGRRVLDGVDLVLPGGALIAVAGRSGSGKTVLAGLVGRLVDPDEGDVLLDGVPLRDLSRRALRDAVAYGFERPALLGGTIAEAIAFGDRPVSDDEVVHAARAARADEFVRRMPEGYRTPLARAPMSGGERQRLGLARAFAHGGRVLVLDDVAASLDTVTEHHISVVLTDALANRTRIVVAHRASTAARADAVVWLHDGRVRAMATHAQLWDRPDYRALFAPVDGAGA